MGFSTFVKTKYKQTNSILNQISLIFIILGIGFLMLNSINKNNFTDNTSTDNIFKCKISNTNENLLPVESLNTTFSISIIDYSTDVFKTALTKNSIPALLNPKYDDFSKSSNCLSDDELAVVIVNDSTVLVFPLKILRYHIAINTYINDQPILISYSPLADHIEVFSRNYKNSILEFGVSGSLYKNADLLYDLSSESLWSQFNGKALIGNYTGATLEKLTYKIFNIGEIHSIYSDFKILSFDTGYMRNYDIDTFVSYKTDGNVIGTIKNSQTDFENKDIVLGFNIDNTQYALLESSITDNIEYYSEGVRNFEISKFNGEYLINIITSTGKTRINDYTTAYAFVWYDFFPLTKKLH